MTNKTIYDNLKGNYVRVIRKSGAAVGKLVDISFDRAVLNPFIIHYDTPVVSSDIRLEFLDWSIPYDQIETIHPLSDGEAYMKRIVEDAELQNDIGIQMRIADMRSKGILTPDLEARLKERMSTKP